MGTLDELLEKNLINDADYYFARHLFLDKIKSCQSELPSLAALVSSLNREGHICVDFENLHRLEKVPDIFRTNDIKNIVEKNNQYIGAPGEFKPFIYDGKRIYLHKYFEYENFVASNLSERSRIHYGIDERCADAFAKDQCKANGELNLQNLAVFMGLRNNLSFISGGPGTGKTTTVARLLYYHLLQNKNINIALAAPTGKAAARMGESLSDSMKRFHLENTTFSDIQTMTIHRLLGYSPHLGGFRYCRSGRKKHHPALLGYDLIVVDEASMIDLSLMFHLLKALPLETKLVFLGDRRQLASVAPGAVFGDICDIENINAFSEQFAGEYRLFSGECIKETMVKSPMGDNIVELRKSYRYKSDSDIAKAAGMIEKGESSRLKDFLVNHSDTGEGSVRLTSHSQLSEFFRGNLLQHYIDISKSDDIGKAYKKVFNYQILTPLKRGRFSTESINNYFINALKTHFHLPKLRSYFNGMPVLINKNDYTNRLFNGDLGLIFGENSAELKICFPSQEDSGFRQFRLKDIYGYEFAYCLTVHKSQGSEFENVVLVLPEKSDFLSRELIYTALTRARHSVVIIGNPDILAEAVSLKTTRMSGLREKIHGATP
ncbi:exodeoxyribonuclease V subunit alpha [Flexistipes sp.]|uniref:exodeoxyribonuclease V subunit alpha n=1 Tax=Flexistipes sp. TaxID=3088135 RepID=UPI002E2166EA|nr:exodeoxyribonuclease V subunit alpha [Flexistipes sp.]